MCDITDMSWDILLLFQFVQLL